MYILKGKKKQAASLMGGANTCLWKQPLEHHGKDEWGKKWFVTSQRAVFQLPVLVYSFSPAALCCDFCFVFFGQISLPRLASAEVRVAGLPLWAGEAASARPAAEPGGGLEVILGVTTAGEPGPKSMRLSSVVSLNVWKGVWGRGGGVHPARQR